MPRVSKKNISGVLQDIKHPSASARKKRKQVVLSSNTVNKLTSVKSSKKSAPKKYPKKQKGRLKRKRTYVYTALILLSTALVFNFLSLKDNVVTSADRIQEYIVNAKDALSGLNTGDAKISFEGARDELKGIEKDVDKYGFLKFSSALGNIFPALKNATGLFSNIKKGSDLAVSIVSDVDVIARDGVGFAFSGRGNLLIERLESMQPNIETLRSTIQDARNQFESLESVGGVLGFGNPLGSNYLAMDIELARISDFVSGLLSLLKSEKDAHILVLFQNPSEMRPSGGFLGSYADIKIKQGDVVNLDVRDVYDADGQLDLKTIPPIQLQAITKSWGARDANWFFDFPSSAQKITHFLESSKIYKEQEITFDGVVAINANVVQDVIALTGPIELEEYELTIDKNNFLSEIQKEVESTRSRATGQPKQILKTITPIITKRLLELNDEQKRVLLASLGSRISDKDIQIYFKDPRIENFMISQGVGGEIMPTPQNFNGDYLAVVNSNIAGGKTDIFMDQNIKLISTISQSGKIRNSLSITRAHNGDKEKFSLYRLPNQNYIRIFALSSSELLSVEGSSKKTITPQVNYKNSKYNADLDIEKIEGSRVLAEDFDTSTSEESGKTVFGTWFNIGAGAEKTLEVDYERAGIAIGEGKQYQFVFEKQSGVPTGLDVTIESPSGYKWRESNSSIFSYQTDNPQKRIILNLTFVKL